MAEGISASPSSRTQEHATDIRKLSVEGLCEFFNEEGVNQDVVNLLEDNMICGDVFSDMTEEDLKDLAPRMPDRVRLRKLKQKYSEIRSASDNPQPSTPSALPLSSNQLSSIHSPSTPLSSIYSPNTTSMSPFEGRTRKDDSSISTPKRPRQSDDSWLKSFKIPSEFSVVTMDVISSEDAVVTSKCRNEIIQALGNLIWNHTHYPSSNAYNIVCERLINAFPKLADDAGDDEPQYLSWKAKLRDRLKFLRRPAKHDEASSSKRAKVVVSEKTTFSEDEMKEYEVAVKTMQKEMDKAKPRTNDLCSLMKDTFVIRKKWIERNDPSVSDILLLYPAFRNHKILKQELKLKLNLDDKPVTSLMEHWELWKGRIYKFAKLECNYRVNVKELLHSYEQATNSEKESIAAIQILSQFLIVRNKKKEWIIYCFEDTVDIDDKIAEINQSAPYIIILESLEAISYLVVVESEVLIETESIQNSVLYLFAAYYSFNISYPRSSYAVLLFIQRYVFGEEDQQKVTKSMIEMVTAMKGLK